MAPPPTPGPARPAFDCLQTTTAADEGLSDKAAAGKRDITRDARQTGHRSTGYRRNSIDWKKCGVELISFLTKV